jgi:hypothetical protein
VVPEDLKVVSEHPRLLLTQQRLRRLTRERERQAPRWEQFQLLINGRAPMPEDGFAYALFYRVTRDSEIGRRAAGWAAGPGSDIRQIALVWDWCRDLLTTDQAKAVENKLFRSLQAPVSDAASARNVTFAAIALAERLPDQGEAHLRKVIEWWRTKAVPELKAGRSPIARQDHYALFEMLHALRDNLNIELRDDAGAYFKTLPTYHLVSHYPAVFPAAENQYRIPVFKGSGSPNLNDAILSRAAALAMVAYDTNALENQFIQGWAMQDPFMMRGPFGCTYEFLWANPYQPGLSYFHVPLVFHDPRTGHVFARSSWDEDATWIGYFDGLMQTFEQGKIRELKPSTRPLNVGPATFFVAHSPMKFAIESEAVFLLGLKPRTSFDVEVDDEEMVEMETDIGGTLVLSFPLDRKAGVRLKDSGSH